MDSLINNFFFILKNLPKIVSKKKIIFKKCGKIFILKKFAQICQNFYFKKIFILEKFAKIFILEKFAKTFILKKFAKS